MIRTFTAILLIGSMLAILTLLAFERLQQPAETAGQIPVEAVMRYATVRDLFR